MFFSQVFPPLAMVSETESAWQKQTDGIYAEFAHKNPFIPYYNLQKNLSSFFLKILKFQNRAADSTKFPRKICGKSFLEYTSLFSTASNPAANLAESLFVGRKAIGYRYSFSVCFSTMQLGKVCGSCLVQRLPQLLKLSLFVPKDLFLPIFSVQNTFHKWTWFFQQTLLIFSTICGTLLYYSCCALWKTCSFPLQ